MYIEVQDSAGSVIQVWVEEMPEVGDNLIFRGGVSAEVLCVYERFIYMDFQHFPGRPLTSVARLKVGPPPKPALDTLLAMAQRNKS